VGLISFAVNSVGVRMNYVRFQVLPAASMNLTDVWDVAPCSLVEVDRRFRGAYCLEHQDDEKRRSASARLQGALS
jgi:hypothetical protein